MATTHDAEILDQFTRQAEPFLQRHAHNNEALLQLMLQQSGADANDRVLDIACGPGIVSCFFARHVRSVTGLDYVPAMLERASKLQAERELTNIKWLQGSANDLPFADASFDRVITRFSFHHFETPEIALREMKRVCRPGGTVLVTDVTPTSETQEMFNHWEILRDPSHTRGLTRRQIEELGEQVGLGEAHIAEFQLEMDLDALLSASFPKPGDEDKIRALFERDIEEKTDRLGVATYREDDAIKLVYPVTVFAWCKQA